MGEPRSRRVTTSDGRVLEVLDAGAEAGFPLLYHGGTPSAAVPGSPFDEAAAGLGLRLVTYSRPGYGDSTPWPKDRLPVRVADDVPDSLAVLDALGIGEFVTLGWSGGGPRALACAALAPDRCRGAAVLAGVAPYDADGLDWLAGMGPENVRDFTAAAKGAEALRPYIEEQVREFREVGGEQIVEAFGELVDEVDAAAMTGALADHLAATMRAACRQGPAGYLDDAMAVVQPWGFGLSDIRVPVAVWQGRHDLMVPFTHGEWLAAHLPGAPARLFDDEGHVSLVMQAARVLADLKDLAGL
jgi:pimeloyl-ACP methyl ester carboxylesterase